MIQEIKYTIVMLFVFIIIFGCTSKKKNWENTKLKNTTLSYENYLNKYPQGLYSDSAKIHLEKLYFQEALFADTIPNYEAFINKYPQSIFRDSVNLMIKKIKIKGNIYITGTMIQMNGKPLKGANIYFLLSKIFFLTNEEGVIINPKTKSDEKGQFLLKVPYKFINKNKEYFISFSHTMQLHNIIIECKDESPSPTLVFNGNKLSNICKIDIGQIKVDLDERFSITDCINIKIE